MSPTTHWIEDYDQLDLLTSPMRQEIFDSIMVNGPSSIPEIAHELGVPADSLYYHVKKMVNAGILVEQETRATKRRAEKVYNHAHHNMRLRYAPQDPLNVELMCKAAQTILRTAERDYRRGFRDEHAIVEGGNRNLWASRLKVWLSENELKEVNEILERMYLLTQRPRQSDDQKLVSFAWVMAPLESKPVRRENT